MTDFSLERLAKIRTDPWEFACRCVFTLDQVDQSNPVKKFPSHFKYLKLFYRVWQKYPMVAIPKSRRMFMSWANLAVHLWLAMTQEGRSVAFVSKKEDDADELIRKAKFILEHIPEEEWPKELRPKWEYKYGQLFFPELNSKIQGFPQGADQLRQYTFSAIMADEMAFWEDAEQMFAASFPTLEGGGRFTAISSPAPGFFKRLVFDRISHAGDDDPVTSEKKSPIPRFPMQGVEIWQNAKNKFLVFQLHYSANEKKTDPSYREGVRASMPYRQYMQEYELQWDSFEGLPVYADWEQTIHGVNKSIEPVRGLPLLRGFDFGLTPACVIGQYVDDQLFILLEVVEVNMGAERFTDRVLRICKQLFPEWHDQTKHWHDFMDPSGAFRKDTDESSCALIMQNKGLRPIPGALGWEERRTAVEYFLTRRTKNGPCFQISLENCPVLVRGFNGGYRYSENALEREPTKVRPLKDEHSHPHDALQYLCSRVVTMRAKNKVRIPTPAYAWGQKRI